MTEQQAWYLLALVGAAYGRTMSPYSKAWYVYGIISVAFWVLGAVTGLVGLLA